MAMQPAMKELPSLQSICPMPCYYMIKRLHFKWTIIGIDDERFFYFKEAMLDQLR